MIAADLTADQQDALQEVVNIAMGQAGSALAQVLGKFITLSIPRTKIIDVADTIEAVSQMVDDPSEVTAVRQAFISQVRGEALVIFGKRGCSDLADLMGYDTNEDSANEEELLLEVSNVLVGACLNGISEQLGMAFSYSAPSIMGVGTSLDKLLTPDKLPWRQALLVEVNFKLEDRHFQSHLVILTAGEAIGILRQSLDHILSSL